MSVSSVVPTLRHLWNDGIRPLLHPVGTETSLFFTFNVYDFLHSYKEACKNDDVPKLRQLMDDAHWADDDLKFSGQSLLSTAIKYQSPNVAEYLLDNNLAFADSYICWGAPPLHIQTAFEIGGQDHMDDNKKRILLALLRHGASAGMISHLANRCGDEDIIREVSETMAVHGRHREAGTENYRRDSEAARDAKAEANIIERRVLVEGGIDEALKAPIEDVIRKSTEAAKDFVMSGCHLTDAVAADMVEVANIALSDPRVLANKEAVLEILCGLSGGVVTRNGAGHDDTTPQPRQGLMALKVLDRASSVIDLNTLDSYPRSRITASLLHAVLYTQGMSAEQDDQARDLAIGLVKKLIYGKDSKLNITSSERSACVAYIKQDMEKVPKSVQRLRPILDDLSPSITTLAPVGPEPGMA